MKNLFKKLINTHKDLCLVLGMNVLVAIYGKVILLNVLCRIGFRIVYLDGLFYIHLNILLTN